MISAIPTSLSRRRRPVAIHEDSLPPSEVEVTRRAAILDGLEKSRIEAQSALEQAIVQYFYPSLLGEQPSELRRFASAASGKRGVHLDVVDTRPHPYTPPFSSQWNIPSDIIDEGAEWDHSAPILSSDELEALDDASPAPPLGLGLELWPAHSPLPTVTISQPTHDVISSSPISRLPAELLEQIFLSLPSTPYQVLTVLSVNSYWRSLALELSPLYTSTSAQQWDTWPTWMLEDWVDRTKGRPMSIQMGWQSLIRIAGDGKRRSLVRFCQAFWESLEIGCGVRDAPVPFSALEAGTGVRLEDTLRVLLQCSMPKLRELEVRWGGSSLRGWDSGDLTMEVQAEHVPVLEMLRLTGLAVIISPAKEGTSWFKNIRDVRLHDITIPQADWASFFVSVQQAENIGIELCRVTDPEVLLDLPSLLGHDSASTSRSLLPMSKLKTVRFMDATSIFGMMILRLCALPVLKELIVEGGLVLSEKVWCEISETAPSLTSLTITHSLPRGIIDFLTARGAPALHASSPEILFPNLRHLTLHNTSFRIGPSPSLSSSADIGSIDGPSVPTPSSSTHTSPSEFLQSLPSRSNSPWSTRSELPSSPYSPHPSFHRCRGEYEEDARWCTPFDRAIVQFITDREEQGVPGLASLVCERVCKMCEDVVVGGAEDVHMC